MSTQDARKLARHLVLILAEDFDLAEVADVLSRGAQLAQKAIEICDRQEP